MNAKPLVAIALSGGVDSSVAAGLLVQAGYPVVGLMLRLWSEPGNEMQNKCCTPDSIQQARNIASQLKIPFYVLDARQIFQGRIVHYFLDSYRNGSTPNPCMLCNQWTRWGYLLQKAVDLGAQYLATGHYARLRLDADGKYSLLKGIDLQKDQSYVLAFLQQEQLRKTLFPLGEYQKTEVRKMAERFGFDVFERPDSQDLCFLGNQDYREFLSRNLPGINGPGNIVTLDQQVVGKHNGLANYTIGQRKGIKIAAGFPYYVVAKDLQNNQLIIGKKEDTYTTGCHVGSLNWVKDYPPGLRFSAMARVRYNSVFVPADIKILANGEAAIRFHVPVSSVTPGQAVVLYEEEVVLGGGIIINDGKPISRGR